MDLIYRLLIYFLNIFFAFIKDRYIYTTNINHRNICFNTFFYILLSFVFYLRQVNK